MRWSGRFRRPRTSRRHLVALTVSWLLLAVPLAVVLFLSGSRSTVVAGHNATVRPTVDGFATLDLGPYIPSFRLPTGGRLGASIDLGATELSSYEALIERYAFIASQPEGQVAKVRSTLADLAVDSAILGALGGLVAPALVLLVGRERWRQLAHPWTVRRAGFALLGLAVVAGSVVVIRDDEPAVETGGWVPLQDAVPDLVIPAEAAAIQVESGLITSGTRRLVESALDTYRKSLDFYRGIVDAAPALTTQLRTPQEGEVVGLLVSDRHDNVGMDPVARAIADAGGATFLLDAGDDTSTGSSWEAFSLESLDEAFDDMDDRYAIAGNHDNGDFVVEHFDKLGFTTLQGEVVEGPGGIRLLGASDVRSSGLGSWRDERGISFAEQSSRARGPGLRAGRRRRAGVHASGARRQQRTRGAGPRLRGPRPRRAPARAGRTDRGLRRERSHRLDLHQRHDRGRGVRGGHRQQAATRRAGHPGHLPRRTTRGGAAGGGAHDRRARRRRLHASSRSTSRSVGLGVGGGGDRGVTRGPAPGGDEAARVTGGGGGI